MGPSERDFKANCRAYLYQKDRIDTLQRKHSYLFDDSVNTVFVKSINDPDAMADYEFLALEKEMLENNIANVEIIFGEIESRCGRKAKRILWEYLIDRKPMDEIKKDFTSKRTAERIIGNWMKNVFAEERYQ